ncbi:glucose-6-phosphate dehydrogenase assembly protein OpcA [Corynebacterium breve]|uniref:Glucose-6-phosphate dehydrogenase assembly protein OpcA n=1 Tax=Corynebacterium breve TaxID=3049799 RepID=A0ABY8VGU9_9CORY|nr:glucose-6-phosphate dehydrogenase assembly protein OpcA [Corynebacterium breve]WIM68891.1 glucose-6-phosphate dehydrogenase assembly protein OpcA [Corynebacterium breve]
MIVSLPDTSTSKIAKTLLQAQEHYSLATGRVLTLIVVAHEEDDIDGILDTVRDASHEHPSRVLVLVNGGRDKPNRLDAEAILAADAGASEMVFMHLYGELTEQLASIVTPLLLPDTPIVAWWPTTAPARPSEHPLGKIAQRRITNARHNVSGNSLLRLSNGYAPGDSDMMWSRITLWRGIVASALDRYPHDEITAAEISGPADNPSVDIAAGWLSDRLRIRVTRHTTPPELQHSDEELFPIRSLTLHRESGPVIVEVQDERTMRLCIPHQPDALVAANMRTDADCLSEELRHLDPDLAYQRALDGLTHVMIH